MRPKTLYLHSRGQQVRALQVLSKKYETALVVDGVFGPRTERAVRAAQRKLGILPADGIAGPHTLDALAKAATPLPRPAPPQHTSFGAQLGVIAHHAGAAVASAAASAEHGVITTLEQAIAVIEKFIAGPVPKPHPVPASLNPVVQPSKAKAQTEPQPPGELHDPKTMIISEAGRKFVFEHEAGDGGKTAVLHHPSAGSGVTLGPGYDMGGRRAPAVVHDMMLIGVPQATAEAVSKAAGLYGAEADAFIAANPNVIRLDVTQQILLEKQYQGPLERQVRRDINVSLHQYEFDALVSFSGNSGKDPTGWNTTARLVNDHKYLEAAAEFRKYAFSGGVYSTGLVNRRDAEVALFLYGNYHWQPAHRAHRH